MSTKRYLYSRLEWYVFIYITVSAYSKAMHRTAASRTDSSNNDRIEDKIVVLDIGYRISIPESTSIYLVYDTDTVVVKKEKKTLTTISII